MSSSGRNWIPIRGKVGKVRTKLAKLLSEASGCDVQPEDLCRTNPTNQHYEDCCAWSASSCGTKENPVGWHFYSWMPMTELAKAGIELQQDGCSWEVYPKSKEKP